MGLSYTYLSKGDTDMAGQGTTAEVRVYRTVDGELVGEGDPRGAFLAYAPGHPVPAGEVEAYNAFVGREHASKADRANRGDDEARRELRDLQSGETRRAANEPPVLMHDRLATELADEARTLANRGPEAFVEAQAETGSDDTYTAFPVYRTETGDLVHEGHPDAATLAYPAGAKVADGDVDQFNDLGEPPAPADDDNAETPADAADTTTTTRKTTRTRRS